MEIPRPKVLEDLGNHPQVHSIEVIRHPRKGPLVYLHFKERPVSDEQRAGVWQIVKEHHFNFLADEAAGHGAYRIKPLMPLTGNREENVKKSEALFLDVIEHVEKNGKKMEGDRTVLLLKKPEGA